jgi:hypothetical protein
MTVGAGRQADDRHAPYSIDPPIPAKPSRTIATRLLLIGYAPTDPEAIGEQRAIVSSAPTSAPPWLDAATSIAFQQQSIGFPIMKENL